MMLRLWWWWFRIGDIYPILTSKALLLLPNPKPWNKTFESDPHRNPKRTFGVEGVRFDALKFRDV